MSRIKDVSEAKWPYRSLEKTLEQDGALVYRDDRTQMAVAIGSYTEKPGYWCSIASDDGHVISFDMSWIEEIRALPFDLKRFRFTYTEKAKAAIAERVQEMIQEAELDDEDRAHVEELTSKLLA